MASIRRREEGDVVEPFSGVYVRSPPRESHDGPVRVARIVELFSRHRSRTHWYVLEVVEGPYPARTRLAVP